VGVVVSIYSDIDSRTSEEKRNNDDEEEEEWFIGEWWLVVTGIVGVRGGVFRWWFRCSTVREVL